MILELVNELEQVKMKHKLFWIWSNHETKVKNKLKFLINFLSIKQFYLQFIVKLDKELCFQT